MQINTTTTQSANVLGAAHGASTMEYMMRGLEEVRPPRSDDEKWFALGAYLEVATKHDLPCGEFHQSRIFVGERDGCYHVSFVHLNWAAVVSFSGTRLVESTPEKAATSARGSVRTYVLH